MNEEIFLSIVATNYMSSSLHFNDDDNKDLYKISNSMTGVFMAEEDTVRSSLFIRSMPSPIENEICEVENPDMLDSSNMTLWAIWEAEDRARFSKGEVFNSRNYPKNSINPSKPMRISRLW